MRCIAHQIQEHDVSVRGKAFPLSGAGAPHAEMATLQRTPNAKRVQPRFAPAWKASRYELEVLAAQPGSHATVLTARGTNETLAAAPGGNFSLGLNQHDYRLVAVG